VAGVCPEQEFSQLDRIDDRVHCDRSVNDLALLSSSYVLLSYPLEDTC
jgi:hypothetical protein